MRFVFNLSQRTQSLFFCQKGGGLRRRGGFDAGADVLVAAYESFQNYIMPPHFFTPDA